MIQSILSRVPKKLLLGFLIVLITALSVGLRIYAAKRLPIDYDERVYTQAAVQYNNYIRQGQVTMLAWDEFNSEHPPFYKILVGFALFTQPPLENFDKEDFVMGRSMSRVAGKPWGMVGRYAAVFFGGLMTLVLSAINPFAGLFFAIDTMSIKYTSTFFLEALPALANLLAVLCYLRMYQGLQRKPDRYHFVWLVLCAAFLGVSVASKYTYAVAAIAIAIHFIGSVILKKIPQRSLWQLAALGTAALVIFFLCDPYLWKHTYSRLVGTFAFHANHPKSNDVTPFPVWQPLAWLSASFPHHFENARAGIRFEPDTIIGLLALAGLPRLFRRNLFIFIWLAAGFALLLMWPVKWPQYTMIVMAPLCLSAAAGIGWLYDVVKNGLNAVRQSARRAPNVS